MSANIGKLDVLHAETEGKKTVISILYNGKEYKIYFEMLSDMGAVKKDALFDSWFLNGKEIVKIFREKQNASNFPILGSMFNIVHELVFDQGTPLPIMNIDVDYVIENCDLREDLIKYILGLSQKRP